MAYDAALADRLRRAIRDGRPVTARRMMGGVCFLIDGNMLGGAHREKSGQGLFMFRVGKDREAEAPSRPGARPFVPDGRRMRGIVFVAEELCDEASLKAWVDLAPSFVAALPPK